LSTVGILGGSFDPVHSGHLALARHARAVLALDCVLLLPCADPPHKPGRALAARYHRLEMLELAIEDRPGVRVSTLEIAEAGVHYTIDTLRALRRATPSLLPVFLCGSDALAEIDSWREYETLLAEFDFAAVNRPGLAGEPLTPPWPDIVTRRVCPLPTGADAPLGTGGRIFRLDMPGVAVSSSAIRARCAAGAALDDLVAVRVARYIQRHRIYSEEAAR
jgi:nicotinate-nucleotide adenylyltransferase